jgi:hypothetical protein
VTAQAETQVLRYRQAPHVLSRSAGDVVLLLPRTGRAMLSLTGSGMHLWRLLAEARSVSESAEALAAKFGVAAEDVAHDIGPVIDQLHQHGVLIAETDGP